MTTFVALDLETTGLDNREDEIIDIGAVRFTEHRIEDEFATLVRPQGHISGFIARLTGITDAMVARAPRLEDVLDDLTDFLGEAVIVGHNIRFDLGFLEAAGMVFNNEVVDTYELASVLMPDASRYGLGALGQALGIPFRATHRALDDARVNAHLYLRLAEMIDTLPLRLVANIVEMGVDAAWLGTWPFQQALMRRTRAGERPAPAPRPMPWQAEPPRLAAQPPDPETEGGLDAEAVAALLEPGGALERRFPQFEHRTHQVQMARAVSQAFDRRHHLIVEAGTGTGKSLAYLLPAALFAREHNTRVVISTNTRALQDQLIQKDIPLVQEVIGQSLRAAVLKGRANYLCPHRLNALLEKRKKTPDEARVLAKVLVWLHGGGTGDRAEINLRGAAENAVWQRISADAPACTAENCLRYTDSLCPFQRARTASEEAHLLVVNHALLLSDVASGSRVLPEYHYLIVDEAHHLESALTSALSFEITREDLRRLLSELGGPRAGLLGALTSAANGWPADARADLRQAVDDLTTRAFMLQEALNDTFRLLTDFMEDAREGRPLGQYAQQVRITPAVRLQPQWEAIEISWDDARRALFGLTEALRALRETLASGQTPADEKVLDLANELANIRQRLDESGRLMHGLIAEPADNMVYWAELRPRGRWLALRGAPLEVGNDLRSHIWEKKETVVLTSATLTTGGDTDYLRQRLAAEEADELILGSPFDYEHAALLYVVNDIPEPNRPGYQQAVERTLTDLAKATRGRMLALFTSYAQLQRTARAIRPALEEAGLAVYEQGGGASPQALLEEFRTSDGAVLLGTRSFWEGVDIPGEALSVLVIVKLPFAVPSDPLVAARAETFENPFNDYQLPEAILAFRQGFGRLIRTKTDRGVVAVLDKRLLSRRYGQLFLDSLPPCTRHQGPMHRLPAVASRWLARGFPEDAEEA